MNDITTRARALLADATPGPWQVRSGSGVAVEAVSKARGMRPCGDPYPLIAKMPKSYASDYANAAIIAAAPELIAALCDEVERLRARIDAICAGYAAAAAAAAIYADDAAYAVPSAAHVARLIQIIEEEEK